MRLIQGQIRALASMDEGERFVAAKEHAAPLDLVVEMADERTAAGRRTSRPAGSRPRPTPRS